VTESAPEFGPALEALGQAYLKQGEATRAVPLLERAIKLRPDWPDGRALLGRAYMATGRREEARREFEAAKRLSEGERRRLEEQVNQPRP
jgi:Flp pilus assembly protein TadD